MALTVIKSKFKVEMLLNDQKQLTNKSLCDNHLTNQTRLAQDNTHRLAQLLRFCSAGLLKKTPGYSSYEWAYIKSYEPCAHDLPDKLENSW